MEMQASCVMDNVADTSHHEEFIASIGTQTQPITFVDASTQTMQPLHVEILCNLESPSDENSNTHSSTPAKPSNYACPSPSNLNLSESFVLSTSNSESESIDTEEEDLPKKNCTTTTTNSSNDMCIVFLEHLSQLFVRCFKDLECMAPIATIEKFFTGSLVTIKTTCNNNHSYVWRSQPLINKYPLGNVIISAATLFTGNTYHTISEIAEVSCIKLFSERTFYEIQNQFLFPTIQNMYALHQKELLSGKFYILLCYFVFLLLGEVLLFLMKKKLLFANDWPPLEL